MNEFEPGCQAHDASAFLDMQAAANQVAMARDNLKVSQENLDLVRQKLQVGVSDNVEVVQGQQAVASTQLDLINCILAHNVAKLTLAACDRQRGG